MRRAPRIDPNQPAIVEALERAGCSVQSLAAIGVGCPDIIAGFKGVNLLFEIKNPESARGKAGLNDGQKRWHRFWVGQVATVSTPQEALDVIAAEYLRLAVPPC